ncbi:vanadium-dependent haloperoxidase [Priestia taiwanensis]|uniref:Vanadium-dependent haloperoxidase n=1 Tax=Priestia taiwanensis TaxID=1347902 RepID=A0A917ER06_9BACI|nr:vanadium-dependent haloperoxidase [Priestia taiwanensis]MBM7363229.1 membrane-associated phospholipid phosphatase [Priestia taiwanensis]GGE68727.1 vanadium-dependent haloperoxidase [Priestia taiwanensis]
MEEVFNNEAEVEQESTDEEIVKQEEGKKDEIEQQGAEAEVVIAPQNCEIGPLSPEERVSEALTIRIEAAQAQADITLPNHPCNDDETRYPNKIASYSKGFPHNYLGEVDVTAYEAWINALKSGDSQAFESLPIKGVTKLKNPQAAYAYNLIGADSHHLSIAPAPEFSSAWEAAEMGELYWQALTRDVPFAEYDTNKWTRTAAADLSKFSDFRGPKGKDWGVQHPSVHTNKQVDGANPNLFTQSAPNPDVEERVTTKTLFRGTTQGDLIGPYLSQFLCQKVDYGAASFFQKYHTAVPYRDYMTCYRSWLHIQNGGAAGKTVLDSTPRYIRNNRDLGEFVHKDFSYQACLSAGLMLLSYGQEALAPSNPYVHSKTQYGFVTFGGPHILDLVGKAAQAALEAAWYQKFLVHLRLRPEEFGGRVHNVVRGNASYPINQELLRSYALEVVQHRYGTALLPMAYAEGCPTHTAYPSGHACFVGAGVTMLKAFFNENFIIPDPVVATQNGLALCSYRGAKLTVGNELNKLASNVALGRCAAGVHWRTDASEGMKLGEAVAISILQDFKNTYNEDFSGFTFKKFDGTTITIK